MMNRLLPTEERLSRILPNSSSNCKFCQVQVTADLPHCIMQCASTQEVGNLMLSMVRLHDPTVTASKLLRLEFACEPAQEMPLVWILTQIFLYMWGIRASGKIVSRILTRAYLESKISLLRETRHQNECALISEIVEACM